MRLFILLLFLVFAVFTVPNPAQKPAKSRPAAKATPKPAAQKTSDEKTEWEKASAVTGNASKAEAMRKFIEAFPDSEKLIEARTVLSSAEATLANDKLTAADYADAARLFDLAAKDAPVPMPDALFKDQLSKAPAVLFFRGQREAAIDIAKKLEIKASAAPKQLLTIAEFYMSIENGTEARRIASDAAVLAPELSAAQFAVGLACRIDFDLQGAAAAFAKALELDPDSVAARRGLAEMKRAIGNADEAEILYRELLTADEANSAARAGLILSLFDQGKRAEAETALATAVEAKQANVFLLAGAAYWYAGNGEADKAVDHAQKAINADPRFIWAHIALARGLMLKNDAVAAERVLLTARRYGNFPTMEYEIASARVQAGYFREAAEELKKSFVVDDGMVATRVGGRIPKSSKNITELIGLERRASIFAPTAADSPENAARLTSLLTFMQLIDSPQPDAAAVEALANVIVKGDDKMKVHRQIFLATQMLERNIALPNVVELAKAAVENIDAGLELPNASVAVMASELYENRMIAASKGQYINVPEVPRSTLSAILRGRVEELNGWASFKLDNSPEAVLRLRRSVSVFPADSAWWKTASWRLAQALAKDGQDQEALEMYYKSYRSLAANALKYREIEALYKKVNGSAEGLDLKIGLDPEPASREDAVAQIVTPTPTPETPPSPEATIESTPMPESTPEPPAAVASSPTPEPTPILIPETTPEITASPTPEITPEAMPVPTVETTEEPTPEPTSETTLESTPETTPTAEVTETPTPVATVEPSPSPTAEDRVAKIEPKAKTNELFAPVIITIPAPGSGKTKPTPIQTPATSIEEIKASETPSPEPPKAPTPEVEEETTPVPTPSATATSSPVEVRARVIETPPVVEPCKLTVSESTINIQTGGGDLAIIIGREDDIDLDDLNAVSSSPDDVSIRREVIVGVKARALFVVRSVSSRTGVYRIKFSMPCGSREVIVKVR